MNSSPNRSPNLYAVVAMKNEAHRYLEACLMHLIGPVGVDGILIVDDRSDDGETINLAWDTLRAGMPRGTWHVEVRPGHVPGLLAHEGYFRAWMLQAVVGAFQPVSGHDWILVNDADEFVTTPMDVPVEKVLRGTIQGLDKDIDGGDCLVLGLDEVWQLHPARKRVDKAWGNQRSPRVFRYRGDKHLAVPPFPLATGSVPEYAMQSLVDVHQALRNVHVGYATPEDRPAKHVRYDGRPGHSQPHIDSILDEHVQLEPIEYAPKIWRGHGG